MRRNGLALALVTIAVACITAAAIAGAPGASTDRAADLQAAKAATADQIREAVQTLLRAAVDGDTAAARQLLAPDFQLIDAFGAPETRKAYLDTIAGAVDFVTLKPVSPIKVRLYGNTAIARFQAAFEVVAGPDRLRHRGWNTDLFERRQGHWQLVWSQTTPTPNNPDLLVRALKARP